jgi:hypothetical protein
LVAASTQPDILIAAGAIGEVEEWKLPPPPDAEDGMIEQSDRYLTGDLVGARDR